MFDLKGFRKDRKLSQKQISEVIGIGTSFISQIETGKDPMPGYIPDKLIAAYGKEEVDPYFREPSYAVEAERMLRKRYMLHTGMPAYRKVFADDDIMPETSALDGMMTGNKMDNEWIDRVLKALERRDDLAMLQQREYERQGARIDELLAFLRGQS